MIYKALKAVEVIDSRHTRCVFVRPDSTKFVRDLPVNMEQIEDWKQGAYIQNAMPQLNKVQQEFFLSGFDENAQKIIFGE